MLGWGAFIALTPGGLLHEGWLETWWAYNTGISPTEKITIQTSVPRIYTVTMFY